MKSKHLVDPQLTSLLEQFQTNSINGAGLAEARQRTDALVRAMPVPELPNIVRTEVFIPSLDGERQIRLVMFRPQKHKGCLPVILHIHGGGMVLGSPEMGDGQNVSLADEFDCAVVSVDYRLAPETAAPGNVEDCYAALAWINSDTCTKDFDRNKVVLMGESSGGGLATACALLARDRGIYSINAQFLFAPMLDDRTGSTIHPPEHYGEMVWSAEANKFGWGALLGFEPGGPKVSPYAAPARAENLDGMPHTFIAVGALDLFLHENMDFTRRLSDAGVPVELHVYPGACHGFEIAISSNVAQKALSIFKQALARHL